MNVLVTGGSGYVGSVLVSALFNKGHRVTVLDLVDPVDQQNNFIIPPGPKMHIFKGDIRNPDIVRMALHNVDAVIHLACISNDPASELNPDLTKSINLTSFRPFLQACRNAGVKRFIYASSSSVYGVKDIPNVTEDMSLEPLTAYSRYKAMCEDILREESGDMDWVIIRPATVCGYAPSMRLDLLVHILTMSALRNGRIEVHGGWQYRPNIHIIDMVDAYIRVLDASREVVSGGVFNVGTENLTILDTAKRIKSILPDTEIEVIDSQDPRSYHVNSHRFYATLEWEPQHPIDAAIVGIIEAYRNGHIPNPDDDRYYRVRSIKNLNLGP